MTKTKKISILKNREKDLFEKDITKLAIYCILLIPLPFILAKLFNNIGFDSENNMFAGAVYLVYCFINILIIYFINKDYILDNKTVRDNISVKNFLSLFSVMITCMVLFTIPTIFLDIFLTLSGYTLETVAPANSSSDNVASFLYVSILGPICEEIIFRGLVQRTLEKYSPVIAIFTSAIFFAFYHENFSQLFPMIGVGLVLGYVAYKYSLKASILMHITYNLFFGEIFGIISDFLEKDGEEFLLPIINMSPFMFTLMVFCIIGIFVIGITLKNNTLTFSQYKIKIMRRNNNVII